MAEDSDPGAALIDVRLAGRTSRLEDARRATASAPRAVSRGARCSRGVRTPVSAMARGGLDRMRAARRAAVWMPHSRSENRETIEIINSLRHRRQIARIFQRSLGSTRRSRGVGLAPRGRR